MRRIALMAALVAVLAGCGGDKTKRPPTVARADWAAGADAACQRARDAIVRSGWATDLRELQTVGPAAADVVRTAIVDIGRLRGAPAGADARRFLSGLRELQPMLDDVTRASTAMDVHDLPTAATRLAVKLTAVGASAQRAGLHSCFRQALLAGAAVSNGIRAPVMAQQIVRVNAAFARRMKSAGGARRDMLAAVVAYESALDDLDAPGWASAQWQEYRRSLRHVREVIAHRGSPHALRRASSDLDRRFNRFARRLGAGPVTPEPGSDSEAES